MAMSDAERQRAYRQRLKDKGTDHRLNLVISAPAKAGLERLASHYGEAKRATLERIITEHESAVADGLNAEQRRRYYDGE